MLTEEQIQEQLKQRMQEQEESKDRGLGGYSSYFTVPDNVSQWFIKPTDKDQYFVFDIVPFVVGKHYPTNNRYRTSEGSVAHLLDIFYHKGVGPNNKSVPCPLENFGEPCPLCEKRLAETKRIGRMETDVYKKWYADNEYLFAKRRAMYNVIVRDDAKETAKGIQILEMAYSFSEKLFQEASRGIQDGEKIYFADIKIGRQIWLPVKLKKDGKSWDVGVPRFGKRLVEGQAYGFTAQDVMKAIQLDSLVTHYNYGEIQAMMNVSSVNVDTTTQPTFNESPMGEMKEPLIIPSTSTGVPEQQCPVGAKFGEEYDVYQECSACDIADDCKAAKDLGVVKATPKPKRRTLKTPNEMGDDVPM